MSQRTIHANPAKRFFVEMLTRDIDLDDAIMDLVDNSIDGLLRITKGDKSKFSDHTIRLEISEDRFRILDDCGGIPIEIAENVAFKMGRPYGDERDDDIPTIGMYGIGMKRAMFKMGTDIHVVSRHENDCFEVSIDKEWLENDNEWELEMKECRDTPEDWNTIVTVKSLKSGIKTLFSKDHEFTSKLIDKIGIHYTSMIGSGLKIKVVHGDDDPIVVEPKEITFLIQKEALENKKGILPYIYRERNDGLDITLICGIVGEPPEDDADMEKPARNRIEAGWTIVCNDRIVVYADTSRLTGWGDGLPKFHYQFNNLVGIVIFESNDADKLPVTTTKRGIDASSDTFLRIRSKMIEAMKHFTSYTNKWKNDREIEKKEILSSTQSVSLNELRNLMDKIEFKPNREGEQYVPSLPKPRPEKQKTKVMRFTREKSEIEKIAKCYFEYEDFSIKDASKIAEQCFDEILAKVKEGC